ncbi:PACE efflux transporter [Photobacterium sp. TY1-4]|uniref:PACE efflux transporter n=1 Tax=Photobacterium sp. TY1-4 TaxID=2899122 RepID=UPI0021BF5EAE|nr:PACE efflux transporter [Photobacterium sp. TY1-4]UXI02705.1 PACE efflux transporter [Photobacterium sp. TY1-4]
MSIKERLLHSLLFECFALLIMMLGASLFTSHDPTLVGGIGLLLSLMAMVWNYLYNLMFDQIFGHQRITRTWLMRAGHALGFELGLLVVTVPLLMWALQLDFWTVLILDLGVVVFFLVYAMVFNWLYDLTRAKWLIKSTCVSS